MYKAGKLYRDKITGDYLFVVDTVHTFDHILSKYDVLYYYYYLDKPDDVRDIFSRELNSEWEEVCALNQET